MTKLLELQTQIEATSYEIANDKIKQTERNLLKSQLLDSIFQDLEADGFEVSRTGDGVILTLEPKNTTVYVAVDVVVKNLDYDLTTAINEYDLKMEKQAEREAERLARAEKKDK